MKKTTVEIPGNIAERSTTIDTEIPQEQLEIPPNVRQLFAAITKHDLRKIKTLLIADKAVANAEYKTDVTPLSVAAAHGYAEVVSLLLRHNANANKMYACVDNSTVLHTAAEKGQEGIVERLLPYADVQAKNNDDTTPLHYASQKGHAKIVAMLLKHKANIQATTIQGQTPLHLAIYNQQFAVVEILLKHNADVTAKNCSGHTPLYIAVARGDVEISEILLKHNAPVQTAYRNGKTVLHLASQNRHPAVVGLLLRYNANINAVDIDNITPLYIAAMVGHLEIIKILLENNADIHIAYRKDKTPLQIAKQNGHLQVVALLQSHQELCTSLRRENPDALEVSRLLNNGAILANQDKKLLLNPELSPILAELEKGQISRAFSSIRLCFSPQEMHFDNEFLIICFKKNKDANYFLKTISIIFKPIDCRKTATDFSVRLQWPFSVDETFLEIAHYRQRNNQLEKKLTSLTKKLNATSWTITAITPGPNEMNRNSKIFFSGTAIDSFKLKDELVSIETSQEGVIIELPMDFLLEQEKEAMLDAYIRNITDKITETEAKEAPIHEMKRAQKEEEALERLRISAQMREEKEKEEKTKRRTQQKQNKKGVAFNQLEKENPPLNEKKALEPDEPKPSEKKEALRKRESNFFTSPVAHTNPKQNEDSGPEVRRTTPFDTWRSNPQSSSSPCSRSSNGYESSGPSPK